MIKQVSRFPKDLPGSGWFETSYKRKPKPALKSNITADYVIVGAGVSGLATAHRLAELNPKASIVLLESLVIGFGACGRNSGFMIDLPHNLSSDSYSSGYDTDLAEIKFNRYAIAFATKKAKQFKMDKVAFSIDGKYHAAAGSDGENDLKTYTSGLDAIGEKYDVLDATDMKKHLGIDYYTMGIKTPHCPILQPAKYHMIMADNLPKNVKLFENTSVVAFEDGKNPMVKTENGSVSAGKIILTTNGHLESFGYKKNRLMNIVLTGSMTRQLTDKELKTLGGVEAWSLTPADPLGSSMRKTRDGRILVRNQAIYSPNLDVKQNQIDKHLRLHRQAFDLRFPMFKGMELEYTWGGNLCLSRNHVSVFGEVSENVYTASVQNGLGLAKGTAQGITMAEYLSGHKNEFIDGLLNQDQPSKLFPEPFMSIGAKTVLAYKTWKAGKDL
ncbi:MAG: NAD(P)/FAD-dependent oxidoreductase [Alphaproteobacteria bacterium]